MLQKTPCGRNNAIYIIGFYEYSFNLINVLKIEVMTWNTFNPRLPDHMNKLAKFLTILFVFLCNFFLFSMFFDSTSNEGLAWLFRNTGTPVQVCVWLF